MDEKKPTNEDELLQKVLRDFAQDEQSHRSFARKVEEGYKCWRGEMEVRSKAAGWTTKVAPKHAFQIGDTILASMIDPDPSWSVKPRPRRASREEYEQLEAGAQANEWLLAEQADCDHLGEKQVLFAKQLICAGLSVYKTGWNFSEQPRRRQAILHREIIDEHDNLIGAQPYLGEQSYTGTTDDNFAEVVDVRDFIWHEAAVSLDKAKRVTHRVLYTIEELRALEALGVYKNVSKLTDTNASELEYTGREQDLFEANRAKDMVEVLEQWYRTDKGIRVCSVGNRAVLLRDDPNPFWHGQFPFVVCQSIPDLFRIPGVSEMELIADLQEMSWELLNARLTALQFLVNPVMLIRDDVDDVEQFEWAPMAQWLVTDPQQVTPLQINPLPAQISLEAEQLLKQDLQNIPGASPSLLGQIDNSATTATEVSLTTSLGQRRIAMKKQQMKFAHGRLGEQWMSNNQQFVTEDRLVAVVGAAGAREFREVSPLLLQGDYVIDLEAMDESLMRQQRVAEAQSTLQVAASVAQIFAALSQNPQLKVPMINMQAYMDDVLDAKGITNKQRYWLDKPAALPPGPQQAPQQNGNGNGVTSPLASDQQSPSNEFSMSPEAGMQRMLAQSGGPSNVGVG